MPELETRDLGILSASIGVPSDYVVSADGFSFANEERGCAVTTSFVWNLGVPIYTLSDIESHLDEIIASVMLGFDVADYTIHSAEYGAVGGRDAYRVYFEGTDAAGVSMDMLYLAVQGENPFGCYIILGAWSKGDEARRTGDWRYLAELSLQRRAGHYLQYVVQRKYRDQVHH